MRAGMVQRMILVMLVVLVVAVSVHADRCGGASVTACWRLARNLLS